MLSGLICFGAALFLLWRGFTTRKFGRLESIPLWAGRMWFSLFAVILILIGVWSLRQGSHLVQSAVTPETDVQPVTSAVPNNFKTRWLPITTTSRERTSPSLIESHSGAICGRFNPKRLVSSEAVMTEKCRFSKR